MRHKMAIQLATLRESCKTNFPQVLETLGNMGWAGVQFAGYHGYDPKELAEVVRGTGMKVAGLHVSIPLLRDQMEQLIEDAAIFGTRDLICSNTPDDWKNADGFREMKRLLNEYAAYLKSRGLRLSYHNHAFEFETEVDGQSALRYLLDPVEDHALLAEIDVYWVKKGGYDPYPFIEPYAGRMPIIHLKDMTDDEEQTFAEIGMGQIDFVPILQWGEKHGIEWYVVEQDRCRRDPMESVQISYEQLLRLSKLV
ncbi:TIM barrel protein [Paenibacillus sp. LMG 31461]|uniref:TIM barrel protein n=1 Tax=Paenibacillus plantarum TaxID=2654975 RepID=A0ABX1X635_9BACL|nr:sugar phosphate isomerase/epimerase [Paenibacillus plantarum]NOU63898.1 TIM barrel protein [Paenibacillus plantarum]